MAALLSASMLMSFAACGGNTNKGNDEDASKTLDYSNTDNSDATTNEDREVNIDKNIKVGDSVSFGYWNQTYQENGDDADEIIEWVVLEKQGDKALVVSKYALSSFAYMSDESATPPITWEMSSVRKWLNGTFYEEAFSNNEKAIIETTTVTAAADPDYVTSIVLGNDTQDKVFLLSVDEVMKYFPTENDKLCQVTEVGEARYAEYYGYVSDEGNCFWWTRSQSSSSWSAMAVTAWGDFQSNHSDTTDIAVRPAMWISIG